MAGDRFARIDALKSEAAALPHDRRSKYQATLDEFGQLLDQARAAALARPPRVRSWWSGAGIERAWRNIHSAEALLAELAPVHDIRVRYPDLVANGRQILPRNDQRREALELWLVANESDIDVSTERARYGATLRWVNTESDNAQARVRSFRNVLIAVTLAMTVIAVGFVVIGALAPQAFPVCVQSATAIVAEGENTQQGALESVCPTGRSTPSGGDVPLVAFVGLIGASLASAVGIRKIRGTSTPYSVPLALAVLKLPTGALTAIAGLILIQGEFVPGLSALDNAAQVLAYSIILGYGQELFTRLVDRQGQQLLNSAPGTDPLTPLKDNQLQYPSTSPASLPMPPGHVWPSSADIAAPDGSSGSPDETEPAPAGTPADGVAG